MNTQRRPLNSATVKKVFQSFQGWVEELMTKHGKTAVIPGMEPTGHYWFAIGKFLQDNGMRPVHVNPHHVKKSKNWTITIPTRNDRKDPKTIACLVNEGRFSYPYIPTGVYAEIRNLSNLRFSGTRRACQSQKPACQMVLIYFRSIRTFTGMSRQSVEGWCCRRLLFPEDIRSWVWRA